MEVQKFDSEGDVMIAASVATGLEKVAAHEIQEKLIGDEPNKNGVIVKQGRVYWRTKKKCLETVHKLRSVDRLYLIVKTCEKYVYKETKEETYADLIQMARDIDWSEIVKFWGFNKQFCKGKFRQENLEKRSNPNRQNEENNILVKNDKPNDKFSDLATLSPACISMSSDGKDKLSNDHENDTDHISLDLQNVEPKRLKTDFDVTNSAHDGSLVRFRVTSNRVGKKQPITSPEASYKFGGEIQNLTKWKVDLSNYNLEVMLCLGESSLEVSVALTLQSLHRRNITHFGVTTLRATTAYCMLRMCNIQPGELVIDPMCGSGAIPVEGALEWPNGFYIGGDNTKAATKRCSNNFRFINENPSFTDALDHIKGKSTVLHSDTIRWDVTCLPMKPNSIDVIVSDLPFGKRVGSKMDNRKLYPALLKELARVTKTGKGRACLLTQDKRTIKRAIDQFSFLWILKKSLFINIGGLTAGVFLLHRTKNNFEDLPS